jgi:hypothetical protein
MTDQYVSFDIGIRNMAYCILVRNKQEPMRIAQWDNVDIKGKTARDTTNKLMTLLDHIMFDQVDVTQPIHVLVESQPSKVCQLIKTLQVYILAYFDIVAKYHCNVTVTTETVSPICKLTLTDQVPAAEVTAKGRKEKLKQRRQRYQNNKKAAVAAVQGLMSDKCLTCSDELCDRFTKSKKRDDFADCLLQGLFIARKGK